MVHKICVITAARSEYGLLRWVIDSIYKDPELELQLVVTGGHLSPEQGMTCKYIEKDGYPIAEKVEMLLSSDTRVGIAKSMGVCNISFADTFDRLQPDLLLVLGDRYELLPIVGTALVMRIPVAHISGGDITEGAIDDEIRNAVTMMASLHFPGVEDSAQNIIRMKNTNKNVFVVGEPGLDGFLRYKLWSRQQLADNLNIDIRKKWCLVTLHSETKLSQESNINMVKSLADVMQQINDIEYVVTKANTDIGGPAINVFWKEFVGHHPKCMHLYSSLGQIRYLSFMRQAALLLGNSSSDIVEAPFLGIPVVNIGNRQKGRHLCRNVISCSAEEKSIRVAMEKALQQPLLIDTYWGDGHTSERIVKHLKEYLKND
jgi:UDP-hydrolysing UDP-N-acetyl-D-glucosamine 2-epimerase